MKKNSRIAKTTYVGQYWTCRMLCTIFILLFCRKLFLRPSFLLSDVNIYVFTHDVLRLNNMLLLWLRNAMYVRYFDYVV